MSKFHMISMKDAIKGEKMELQNTNPEPKPRSIVPSTECIITEDQIVIDRLEEHRKMRERFSGNRYSFRGTDHSGPDDMIPQEPGLFAFPNQGEFSEE